MTRLLSLAALIAATALRAQEPTVIIRAGTLLDGTGRSTSNATIVVRGSKIASVGGAGATTGATYDLSRLTVLPGLIDAHSHLAWHFNAQNRLHSEEDGETPLEGSLAMAANAYATLMAGITTVQSPGSPEDKALRES